MYIAMYDEYDEGTGIMKNASDYFDIPTDQWFVTASVDGYWLSSDFQLRTAGAAIKMMKGQIPLTNANPVAHSEGPIYYRNSFESRYLTAKDPQFSGVYPIDPGFNNVEWLASNMSMYDLKCEIVKTNLARTGEYAVNSQGIQANPFLLIDDDEDRVWSPPSKTGTVGQWVDQSFVFGSGDLVGKTIIGVGLGYSADPNGGPGFEVYFDDIIIKDGDSIPPIAIVAKGKDAKTQKTAVLSMSANSLTLNIAYSGVYNVDIVSVNGRVVRSFKNVNLKAGFNDLTLGNLSQGMYVIRISNKNNKVSLKAPVL
jgi:hypothetical protein